MNKKLVFTALFVSAILLGTLTAYAIVPLTIPSSGTITRSPAAIVASPTSIDWGTVSVGTPVTRQVTITNNGQTATTALQLSVTPPTGVTITWDQVTNPVIQPGASVTVTFTLTASLSAVDGAFNTPLTIQ